MFAWLSANIGTIIVLVILVCIVGLVICSMKKDKKNGKSSCGCGSGCSSCPMSGKCHK